MKVVIDMNLSLQWADYLNGRGHEATHWSSIGDRDAKDEVIAEYCSREGAVVLSGDLDFAAYHAVHGTSKPSVIQLRAKDLLPIDLGSLVVRDLTIANMQIVKGAIVTIKGTRMRVTKLPIGNTETY